MRTRRITHAEAVYLARTLNLEIETVWEIIRNVPFSSFVELEMAVHRHIAEHRNAEVESDYGIPTV